MDLFDNERGKEGGREFVVASAMSETEQVGTHLLVSIFRLLLRGRVVVLISVPLGHNSTQRPS